MPGEQWPPLPLGDWQDTYDTLHMWMQIVGKVCLGQMPRTNHFWNVAFRVTPRGLTTPTIPCGPSAFGVTFDFVDHELILATSHGAIRTIALAPRSVADFYREVMRALSELRLPVKIWPMPVEFPDPIRFDEDVVHASYDPAYANRCWRILLGTSLVLEQFRARFVGKCSPVHFFWGSFDLAVTRFSGRRAPERPGADLVTRESYSHEVISHGFWPGSGSVAMPAFYAYGAPEPAGLREARVKPAATFYSRDLGEFLLPYDEVRAAHAPEEVLMEFLESTYEAAADLSGWDRNALERHDATVAPEVSPGGR
jgi:hypothetical protein